MSWSINFIGTAAKVAEALTSQSEKLDGQSKVEYDDALPAMVTLVKQNFEPEGSPEPMVKITASGHGYATNGEQKQRYFVVSLERVYGVLV